MALDKYKDEQDAVTQRIINAEDFFLGPLLNSRNHNEVIKSVIIPKAKEQTGYAFKEISEKHGDFALASFAAIASHNNLRFVVGGVSDKITARDWITDDLNEIESLVTVCSPTCLVLRFADLSKSFWMTPIN